MAAAGFYLSSTLLWQDIIGGARPRERVALQLLCLYPY